MTFASPPSVVIMITGICLDSEHVVTAIRASTEEVFSTMLGLEVTSGEPYTEVNAPGPSDGIIGIIGLAGGWVGNANIFCNTSTGCHISAQMLGMDNTEQCEDVLRAISVI